MKENTIWDVANLFNVTRGFVQNLLTAASSFASCMVHFTQVRLTSISRIDHPLREWTTKTGISVNWLNYDLVFQTSKKETLIIQIQPYKFAVLNLDSVSPIPPASPFSKRTKMATSLAKWSCMFNKTLRPIRTLHLLDSLCGIIVFQRLRHGIYLILQTESGERLLVENSNRKLYLQLFSGRLCFYSYRRAENFTNASFNRVS